MDIVDYKVVEIKNYSLLLQVIKFLKNGFNQSDLFEHKYLEYLLTSNSNSNSDPYGYALFKKDNLEGAMLTALQGYYFKSNGKEVNKVKVIDMCCWYINEKSRVIPALFHAKKITEFTRDSILTGHTFNDIGSNVFRRLGFKKMKAFIYRKFKPNLKKFLFLKTNHIKEIKFPQYDDYVFAKENLNSQKEILNFSINLKNSELTFFSGVIKKTKIKTIQVESFFILWASDYFDLYNSFDNIHKFLFLNYGCVSLYFYCPNYLREKIYITQNYCRNAPFMIKSNLDIDYLPPINSELSLGSF